MYFQNIDVNIFIDKYNRQKRKRNITFIFFFNFKINIGKVTHIRPEAW